jgi:PPM family protein phosphatase
MKLRFAGLSDQGLVRSANQDAYCIDSLGRFFIVADGMGGHAGGEEASRIATQAIREFLEENWSEGLEPAELLRDGLMKANQSIIANQQAYPERADMGTTVVVVLFPEGQGPWCVHVGDSRLYLLRNHQLNQVTEDHTWVAQAVQAGILMPDQARIHPWRHVLAQCLGREDLAQVEVQPLKLQSGDKLLLCSDGLTEEVGDDKIESHLSTANSCDESAERLVAEAKANGGRDNITVVIVGVDEIPADLVAEADSEPDLRSEVELDSGEDTLPTAVDVLD